MFQYQNCMKGYDKWTWGCKSIVGTLTPWQGGWGAMRWVRQHVRQQGCRYDRRAHGERPSKRRQVPLRSLSVQVAKTIGSLHSLQQQTTINAQCSFLASAHTPYPPSHFERYLLWSWYLRHYDWEHFPKRILAHDVPQILSCQKSTSQEMARFRALPT